MSIRTEKTQDRDTVAKIVELEPAVDRKTGERRVNSRGNQWTTVRWIDVDDADETVHETPAWVSLEDAEMMYPVGQTVRLFRDIEVTTKEALSGGVPLG